MQHNPPILGEPDDARPPVSRDQLAWRFVMGAALVFPALMAVDVALAGPPYERAREVLFFAVVTPLFVYFGLLPAFRREHLAHGLRAPRPASGMAARRHRRYGRVITGVIAGALALFIGAKALEVLHRVGLTTGGEVTISAILLAGVVVLGLSALRMRRMEQQGR